MHVFEIPYGQTSVTFQLPATAQVQTVKAQTPPELTMSQELLLLEALDDPLGSRSLESMVKRGQTVAVIISDNTRPCPSHLMLPPLLERLQEAGVDLQDITIIAALGLHRKMTETELRQAVGDAVYDAVRVINHDVDDVVHVGTTKRGTPVDVFRPVVEADVRIALGHVEFHYFAGFSGGAKAVVPGTASSRTITANHSHMLEAGAEAAKLEGNPVREDLEEACAFVGVDFVFNVVLDEHKTIVAAGAGHVTAVHRQLSKLLQEWGLVQMPKPVDLAVVSTGGHPKDRNLYQAQKALDNCAGAVRDGGVLILAAPCPETFGEATFAHWLTNGATTEELLERIQNEFVLGGHKAAAIANQAQRIRVYLVHQAFAEELTGITGFTDMQQAVDTALADLGDAPNVAVFPQGSSLLASVKTNGRRSG